MFSFMKPFLLLTFNLLYWGKQEYTKQANHFKPCLENLGLWHTGHIYYHCFRAHEKFKMGPYFKRQGLVRDTATYRDRSS